VNRIHGLVVTAFALALALLLAPSARSRDPVIVVPSLDGLVPRAKLDGTTILVLRLRAAGAELVSFSDKPCHLEQEPSGCARWYLEDASNGARLDEAPCELPRLCTCPLGHDHATGCVIVHHEAVFRLKVPRLAPKERLRLVSEDGRELGTFLLEAVS